MFIRQKNYDNAIQKVRVELGTLLGLDTDAEAYIVLKELPMKEMLDMNSLMNKKANEGDGLAEIELYNFFKSSLPFIITDHNFYEDENTVMKKEDLADLLFEKVDVAAKIVKEYFNSSFFTQKKKKGVK